MDDPDIWQLYFPTLAFEIAREQYPLDNYVDVARRFFSSGVHSAAGAAPTLHVRDHPIVATMAMTMTMAMPRIISRTGLYSLRLDD